MGVQVLTPKKEILVERLNKCELNDNAYCVALNLLTSMGVRHTKSYVRNFLNTHPNYPSLLSLTDLFKSLNIDSVVLAIPRDNLNHLPIPFIVGLKNHKELNKVFVVVREVHVDHVVYLDTAKGLITEQGDGFFGKWDGNALLVEADEKSGERDYKKNLNDEKMEHKKTVLFITLLVIASALVLFHIFKFNYSIILARWIGILLVKLFAFILSIFLLMKDYGKNTKLIDNLCEIKGLDSFDCTAVLDSKMSSIFGIFKLSELSLLYFSGSILYLLYIGTTALITPKLFFVPSCFAIVLTFFTFFTLYYQIKVIKKLCFLCWGVQVLLWIDFYFLLPFFKVENLPSLSLISPFLLSVILPIIIYDVFKPLLLMAKEVSVLRRKINFFVYDSDTMNYLLRKGRKVFIREVDDEIIISDTKSPWEIVAVLNLYCTHCRECYETLLEYSKDIRPKIIVRLVSNETIIQNETLRHVLTFIKQNKNTSILTDWYRKRLDYDMLKKKFPIKYNDDYDEALNHIQNVKEWIADARILATPTVILNGRLMPSEFDIFDLNFVLKNGSNS